MIDHSQFGEGNFLRRYFDENPPKYRLLVDVGAFGIEMSNTYDLIVYGNWGGLLIEPMPIEVFWEPLREAVKERKNIKILNIAVSDSRGVAMAYIHKTPGHNSLVFEQELEEKKEIMTRTLSDVLEGEGIPTDFDLLSLDTEGLDYRIIKNLFEKSTYRPKIIVVEREKPLLEHYRFEVVQQEETIEHGGIFGRFGYTQIFETHGNKIFVLQEV
jgi:FkbM family methyltransferase